MWVSHCAGSAAAINHLADQHVDAVMAHVQGPIVKGKLILKAPQFCVCAGLFGNVVLLTWVNALTAWLTLASLVGYAFIYTLYLNARRPRTS
ncbi:MAG: hypothetical protein CM15mP74_32510 [Halieaceae bacterium]|nr:MAG: hypothetical protein CM15mP74_32510 [Halieaceae bacterium]